MRIKFLLYALTLLSFSACLDKIDLTIPEREQENLIIQGRLLKGDPSRIDVLVRKLFNFEGIDKAVPVFGTKVTLLDDAGNSFELKIVKDLGEYNLDVPREFPVETGKSYTLRVELNDGRVYESDMEPILPAPRAEGLTVTDVTRREINAVGELVPLNFLQFRINTHLSAPGLSEKARIKWDIEHTYKLIDSNSDLPEPRTCYITETQSLDQIKLFDGESITEDILTDRPLFEIHPDFRFASGYYLTVYQQSLTPGAFEYWDKVRQLVDRTGNMFEAPAGKISSNFHNVDDPDEEVFGYFYASDIDTVRFFVSPQRAGSVTRLCPPNVPPPPGGGCAVPLCCNCLVQENSTIQRPAYWIE